MHMQEVKVTPYMAGAWLEGQNTANRSMSSASVNKYAADMAAGRWMSTHQNAIAFYDDGALADGQHRLAAVVKSGVPVKMFVFSGMPRSASSAIDQGRSRNMSDVMAISGVIPGGRYSKRIVAMMNVIRDAEGVVSRGPGTATPFEMQRAIIRLSAGIDFANGLVTKAKGRLQCAPALAAFCVGYYALGSSPVDRFASVFVSGMPHSAVDETVVVFRNRVLTESASGGSVRLMTYKMGLRFLRAYSEGRIVKVARSGDELAYVTGAFNEK